MSTYTIADIIAARKTADIIRTLDNISTTLSRSDVTELLKLRHNRADRVKLDQIVKGAECHHQHNAKKTPKQADDKGADSPALEPTSIFTRVCAHKSAIVATPDDVFGEALDMISVMRQA